MFAPTYWGNHFAETYFAPGIVVTIVDSNAPRHLAVTAVRIYDVGIASESLYNLSMISVLIYNATVTSEGNIYG